MRWRHCRSWPRPMSPKMQLEQDKRVRREIANSNERRRMQSINAGFSSLKSLIPHQDGEKYSKASILQQTADYVKSLKDENAQLRNKMEQYRSLYLEIAERYNSYRIDATRECEPLYKESPLPKRKKRDTESSDEGISMGSGIESGEEATVEESLCHRHTSPWMIGIEASHLPDPVHLAESHYRFVKVHDYSNKGSSMQEVCKPAASHKPLARHNLELMVQAIQHLEGDRIFRDKADENSVHLQSEESEKEGSLSDPEECKSESSGRESPVMYSSQLHLSSSSSSSHLPVSYSDRYPIAMNLLHHPVPPQYFRPGVIVQKS